jgi:alkanesulfonate monooxygenase SsuD/methylene tetrahydromethanopterin reductase-like flavin-dependent oxidoreductase (luciferase family)
MRLGINVPFTDEQGNALTAAAVMQKAKAIEAAGFDGIWIGDQVGRGNQRPDPIMWVVAAAAGTERIEVGTAILQVPLRRPVELAQRLLTAHALTGGRFTAGVGAGSTPADFEAVGVEFEARFRLLNEALKTMRALCRGERVGAADLRPWPNTLGGPPILVGAWVNGRWVERAAHDFDGWLASGGRTNFRALRDGIKRYREAGGKRAVVATVPVDLSASGGTLGDDDAFTLRCPPDEAKARLERVQELGYDDVLLVHEHQTDASLRQIRSLLTTS